MLKALKVCIRMGKTTIRFGDIEIKKQKFHQHKRSISAKNIDINKIVVCNKVYFGKKNICFTD